MRFIIYGTGGTTKPTLTSGFFVLYLKDKIILPNLACSPTGCKRHAYAY